MVESKLTYEECRRQRLEENKKRMEELNILKLSQSLKTPTPKRSPVKRRVLTSQMASLPVRRSSRFADKPTPNYKEDALEPLLTRRRSYQRRDLLNRVYASDEERMYAIERAEKVQSGLDSEYPSFVKPMLQSHVTGGFWLGLPVQFCKKLLPHHDETITLVDEEGNDFPTKYLADKTGLSAGWRGFSIDHELVDGDALVFHLVKPTTFKVYIIRAYESEDNDDNNSENNNKDSDDTQLDKSAKRAKDMKANSNQDNKNDSDDMQLDRSSKRIRAKYMKDNNDEDNKDSNDTRMNRSTKRTRAKDMKDSNSEDNKDLDDSRLDRSAKRTGARNVKDNNNEDNKNTDDTRLDRNAKRTRAKNKKDNNNEDNKDSGDTQLNRSAKRIRAKDIKDNYKNNKKDSYDTHKGGSNRQTRASRK